jgi:hypothetical protein
MGVMETDRAATGKFQVGGIHETPTRATGTKNPAFERASRKDLRPVLSAHLRQLALQRRTFTREVEKSGRSHNATRFGRGNCSNWWTGD